MLENYIDHENSQKDIFSTLRDRFEFHESEDSTIVTLEDSKGDDQSSYYLDIENPRFWVLFSTAKYTPFHKMLNHLEELSLDKIWLPTQLMTKYIDLESKFGFEGWAPTFDNTQMPKQYFNTNTEPVEYKLQVKGRSSRLFFDILANDPRLKNKFSLSGISLKSKLYDTSDFVIDDLMFNGKITSVGNSLPAHLELVNDLQLKYKNLIQDNLEEYAQYAKSTEGYIKGEPIEIKANFKEINFIDLFDTIFSGAKPFKLWGIKQHTGNDYIKVKALDLHTQGLLEFEIFKDRMLIMLPNSTCGNTLARLFVLLQQHVDSGVSMSLISGKNLISEDGYNV